MSSKPSPLAPERFPDLPKVQGLSLKTAATGQKYQGRDDLLLASFGAEASVAGVFTRSQTRSAAIDHCRACLAKDKSPQALLINAGNANAFTGAKGRASVGESARLVAEALGCTPDQVLLASTGVIGEALPTDPIALGLQDMMRAEQASFEAAAKAILTTDTFAKGSHAQVGQAQICGIAKGSGMIAPDMATMLAFVFTDARISPVRLQSLLSDQVEQSFNSITVDSDTSTSDSLIAVATNQIEVDEQAFAQALSQVLRDLAQQIVRDGEGASKFIEVQVKGASSSADAKKVALAIGNSPLVKTAIAGEDANWGRIVMAVGKSGAEADRDKLSVSMGGVLIAAKGEAVADYDEAPVTEHMQRQEILIEVDLGLSQAGWTIWTCDLTHGYISINADYRS